MASLWNNSDNDNRAHDFLFPQHTRHTKGRVQDDISKEKRDLINRHKDGEISAKELQVALQGLKDSSS